MVRGGVITVAAAMITLGRLMGPSIALGATIPPGAGPSPMPSRAATITAAVSV